MSSKGHNIDPSPSDEKGKSSYSLDYKKYEDNLVASIVTVLLAYGFKAALKKEILPVSGTRKAIETFLIILVGSILGEELVVRMRKDGYL